MSTKKPRDRYPASTHAAPEPIYWPSVLTWLLLVPAVSALGGLLLYGCYAWAAWWR